MVEKNYEKISENKVLDRKNATILKDVKIDVKIKLALIWVVLLFFYLYNDVFTLLQPGSVEELVTGELEGIQFTQTLLFASAVLMAIPIFMVFLSLTLNAKVNRNVNLSLGIFHAVLLAGTLFAPGELWAYYALYMIFEAIFIGLIIWHAWNWPTQDEMMIEDTKREFK